MKANHIKVLSDREHLLLRGEYILGALSYVEREQPMLSASGLKHDKIRYVPALVKMINEIIDNAVDEAVRTGFRHGTRIKVEIDDASAKVTDDGRGIPVTTIEGGDARNVEDLGPVVAFTRARAGANFDDLDRETIGMNGVGAFATNVFSRTFRVTTCDGKRLLKLACSSNCASINVSVGQGSSAGTSVYFEPDFSKMECKAIEDIDVELVRQRLLFLSATHREISFSLNGKTIKFAGVDRFLAQFGGSYELLESKNPERPWFVAVFPSPSSEFVHFTYVNGLYLSRGGNHVDNLSWELTSRLRDKAAKKHPNIRPADIKNRLSLVAFFSRFPNLRHDSQTKENLANATPEVKSYLEIDGAVLDRFAAKVWKNEAIMGPILELHRLQEELKDRRELEKRKPKKVVNDKYMPPIGDHRRLFLCEGDSAVSGLSAAVGRQGNGYFALRGVPLNAYEVTQQRLLANNELSAVIDILLLDLSGKDQTLDYERVVIASDADNDGYHIRGLLLAFFQRFAPWVIEQRKIYMLDTPVLVASDKDGPTRWWRNIGDHARDIAERPLKKGEICKYKKGLGSWKPEEFKAFIAKVGLDSMLTSLVPDDRSTDLVKTWMTRKFVDGVAASEGRKEFIGGRSFDIFSL